MRNFAPDRGAVSFWFLPAAGDLWTFFQVHAREPGVGPNSRRQMDLYMATFLFGTSPVLREGFYRALIRPALVAVDETFTLPELDRDAWHHVVWTWDHTQGMRLFVDGDKVVDNWGTESWIQMMTPGIIKLKSMRACDELLLFGRALSEAEAVALYDGQLPAPAPPAPIAIPPDLEMYVAHSYGLDAGDGYPVLRPDTPVTITPLHAVDARDGRQPIWFALDGNRTSSWPISHIEIANSDCLVVDYGRRVRANHLRVLSDGPRFSVRTGDGRTLWTDEVRPERDGWEDKLVRHRWLPEPVELERLVLDRHGARVGEFWAYDVAPGTLKVAGSQPLHLQPGRVGELGDHDREGGIYALYHSGPSVAIGMTAAPATGSPDRLELAPLAPVHLVTEPMTRRTGVAGLRLRLALVAPPNRSEAVFRVRVVDPVTKERDLFNADLKMRFEEGEAAHLYDLSVDLRDIVLEPGRSLWVWLVPRHGGSLDLAASDLTLIGVPVDVAAREFVTDTRAMVERAYAYSSEPHPWTRSWKWPGDERFYYLWSEWAPLTHLIRTGLGADDPVVGTYWHVLRPDSLARLVDYVDYSRNAELRHLPYTRPPSPKIDNPSGAPAWALYQRELLEVYLDIVQWWHDERLDPATGILRGYGDDTQLTGEAFWLYFCTGDDRVRRLLRSVAEGTWAHAGFYRGYPMRTNDVGHNAEEVVGAWPLLTLSEYGDPRYVEMTMETLSLLDFVTTRTQLGHRHFKSWYFSASEVVTDGDLGIDNFGNSAYTILGHMLSWYNRNPTLTSFYREWADAWLDDFARSRKQGFTKAVSVRIPSETYVEGVYHRPYTMPHQFLITGLLTGDSTYVERALRNDDGFFPDYGRRGGEGMLYRDFAFQRHRLREARFADVLAEPGSAFEKWFVSGDRTPLAEHYAKRVDDYGRGTRYLYTEGQPSTDRLWGLWDENLFVAYLGGYAAGHRRTSNWPGLALSYTDAGTDLASLVLVNRTDEVAVHVYNFARSRDDVGIRLWQLEPGVYRLVTGVDADENGVFDDEGRTMSRRVVVRRGSRVRVPVPYGQMQLVRLTQVEARPEPELLPDLAIGRHDVTYEYGEDGDGRLHVTVHNIGSAPAGPALVHALDRRGRDLVQGAVATLEAPVDLRPRTATVTLPLSWKQWRRTERITVTAARLPMEQLPIRDLEITDENNVLLVADLPNQETEP